MALTSTTTSGGKNPGTPQAFPIFQTGKTLVEEPFAPHAYHLTSRVEALRNLVVGETLGGQQNHSCMEYMKIRQRIFPCPPLELQLLFWAQSYFIWAVSRHT